MGGTLFPGCGGYTIPRWCLDPGHCLQDVVCASPDESGPMDLSFQIEVLPEIVQAVQGRVEVYLDGGVRLGTDVFKALALGARAVFIGRPVVWGLAYQVE